MEFESIFDELIESEVLNDLPMITILKVSTELLKLLDKYNFLVYKEGQYE